MGDVGDSETIRFELLVRANDALDWLAPRIGSRVRAKQEIADGLRDGLIRSFAVRTWRSNQREMVAAWKPEPDEDDEEVQLELDIEVATWVWRHSRQWIADLADWRWPSGRFTVAYQLAPFERILLEHVHFHPDDIVKIAAMLAPGELKGDRPPFAGPASEAATPEIAAVVGSAYSPLLLAPDDDDDIDPSSAPVSVRPTRHLRGHAWAAVILEVVKLHTTGKLQDATYSSQKEVVTDLMNAAAQYESGLKSGSIDPVVSKLVDEGFIRTARKRKVPQSRFST